jgi:hypothetical protein
MSTDSDVTRIVRSWLTEGESVLPGHVLEAVLKEAATIPQRRTLLRLGLRGIRLPTIDRAIGISLVAAAVVLSVVVGGQVLGPVVGGPGANSVVGPSPTATTIPTPSSVPSLPPFTRSDAAFLVDEGSGKPAMGALDPGSYTDFNIDAAGFNVRFTVPAGWTWDGRSLSKGGAGLPGGATISFYGAPVVVYADPCRWAATASDPPRSAVMTFIADLAAQPARDATTPVPRWAGGLNAPHSLAGEQLELTVPADLQISTCDGGQFRSWGPDDVARIHEGPGQHDLVWAVELAGGALGEGQRLVMDASSFPGTPADVMAEIETILRSIQTGHWG